MYLLQVWFSLSDEGVEDAIYDSYAMRRFMGLDFAVEQVPDATTLLHFRHLLEEHQLGEKLFASQNEIFEAQGWIMRPHARGEQGARRGFPAIRWGAQPIVTRSSSAFFARRRATRMRITLS